MKKVKKQLSPIKGMVFAALFAALTAAVSPIKIPLGFTPVPITLQTLMVLLSGAVLGANLGALSQFLYVLVGALGLPVFAGGGSGLGALAGPTGGYLISYPIAAFVIGWIAKDRNKKSKAVSYIALAVLALLLLIIYVDLFFKIGVMEATLKMTDISRYTIAAVSLGIIALLTGAGYYLAKKKKVSANVMLGMVVGTLIIYAMGSIHGKLVTGLPWSAIVVGWVLPFLIGDTIKLLAAAYISTTLDIERYLK